MFNNKPLITVLMPAYNAEQYIRESIESILGQTFKRFELIVVDDVSEDKTRDIVKIYMKKDPRIKLVENKKKLKVTGSANKGIKFAKANIIARMDADDIAFPERLSTQFKFLQDHPEVAVVGANILIIDKKGKPISKREYPTSSKELKRIMFRYSPFAQPVAMLRKEVLEEFGGYDETLSRCEDIDLWFKIGSKYEFASISRFLLKYRLLKNSSSHTKIKEVELLTFKIKFGALIKYGYRPSGYDVVYNLLEFITLWCTPDGMRIWLYNFLRSRKII